MEWCQIRFNQISEGLERGLESIQRCRNGQSIRKWLRIGWSEGQSEDIGMDVTTACTTLKLSSKPIVNNNPCFPQSSALFASVLVGVDCISVRFLLKHCKSHFTTCIDMFLASLQ
jgi:hypothetical protein